MGFLETTLFETKSKYMYYFKYLTRLCLLFVSLVCSLSCVNNITLEKFDLERGRLLKVTTGSPNTHLPIFYEMYSDNVLVQKCFILQESTSYQDVKKLRFKVFSDKSRNIFALMQEEPEKGLLGIFDYSTGFRYPCCHNDYSADCLSKRNELAEIIERDNPELKLMRAKIPER